MFPFLWSGGPQAPAADPLVFLGRNATREQYEPATIEHYRPATREQYEPATVVQS